MKSSQNWMYCWMIILLACVLHACNYPESSLPTEQTDVCSPDSLLAPEPVSPSKLEVVPDSSPDFRWRYPLGCDPEKFTIEVIYHPLMGIHGPVLMIDVPGYQRGWSSDRFLPEGKHYAWRLSAVSGDGTSISSDYAYFFTGPICDDTLLTAPELVFPPQTSSVNQPQPWLQWQYSDTCLPDTFYVELSESPSFSDDNLAAEVEFPVWGRTTKDPLRDCTHYFWRVTAKLDDQLGPFSPTRDFWTDFEETCDFAPVHPDG